MGSRGLGTNTGETREGCAVGTQSRRETMVEKDKGRGQRERAERRAGWKSLYCLGKFAKFSELLFLQTD